MFMLIHAGIVVPSMLAVLYCQRLHGPGTGDNSCDLFNREDCALVFETGQAGLSLNTDDVVERVEQGF